MNFLNDIQNSLYNQPFYAALKDRRLVLSFRYFFSLIALLSIVLAFVFGIEFARVISAENLRKLVDFYPKELTIQVKAGTVSTNVNEPYFIKDNINSSAKDKYTNWVVIDTQNDFSVDTFKKYDTQVLIGKNFFVFSKNRGQFEFNDLSQVPDFSLSQARLSRWSDLIVSYHLLISLCIFAVMFLSFFGFLAIKLIGLIVIALIIILLAQLKKVSLTFKNSYQIVIHAITFPLILQAIFILTNIRAPFPLFFSLILLIIAYVNIKKPDTLPMVIKVG